MKIEESKWFTHQALFSEGKKSPNPGMSLTNTINFNGRLLDPNDPWDIRGLPARWLPRLLTIDHRCNHITTSKKYLALLNINQDER